MRETVTPTGMTRWESVLESLSIIKRRRPGEKMRRIKFVVVYISEISEMDWPVRKENEKDTSTER
jgi:hypothetical protein